MVQMVIILITGKWISSAEKRKWVPLYEDKCDLAKADPMKSDKQENIRHRFFVLKEQRKFLFYAV